MAVLCRLPLCLPDYFRQYLINQKRPPGRRPAAGEKLAPIHLFGVFLALGIQKQSGMKNGEGRGAAGSWVVLRQRLNEPGTHWTNRHALDEPKHLKI